MADINRQQGQQIPSTMTTKYKDMADGTHALVIAAALLEGGNLISNANPLPIRNTIIETVVTPTITAGAYAAGDALGGQLVFTNVFPVAGGSGKITKVVIIDEDQQLAPVDLVLFDQNFTATADNAPLNPSDADMANCLGYISVAQTDYSNFANNSVATKASGQQMPFEFVLAAGEVDLRGQMRVNDTPTYTTTSSLIIKLTIEVHS